MIIALFSSKGGAGGSTILSVMAHLLAARGKSVLVIDTAVDRSQDLYLNSPQPSFQTCRILP